MVKAYCAIENVPEVLKGGCVSIGLLFMIQKIMSKDNNRAL